MSSEVNVHGSESEYQMGQVTLGSGEVMGEMQFDAPDGEEIKDRSEAGSLSTDAFY